MLEWYSAADVLSVSSIASCCCKAGQNLKEPGSASMQVCIACCSTCMAKLICVLLRMTEFSASARGNSMNSAYDMPYMHSTASAWPVVGRLAKHAQHQHPADYQSTALRAAMASSTSGQSAPVDSPACTARSTDSGLHCERTE